MKFFRLWEQQTKKTYGQNIENFTLKLFFNTILKLFLLQFIRSTTLSDGDIGLLKVCWREPPEAVFPQPYYIFGAFTAL